MHRRQDAPWRRELRSHGAVYQLPGRSLGKARWLALIPIAFGLLFSGFAVFWIRGALFSGGNPFAPPIDWFAIAFGAFGVPFVLAGLAPIGLGLVTLIGRNRIEIRGDRVIRSEVLGPFRRSRGAMIADVDKLVIRSGGDGSESSGVADSDEDGFEVDSVQTVELFKDFGMLEAEGAGLKKKSMMLCWGYPVPMQIELAKAIREDLMLSRDARLFDDDEGIRIYHEQKMLDGQDTEINRINILTGESNVSFPNRTARSEASAAQDADDFLTERTETEALTPLPPQPAESLAVVTELNPGLSIALPPRGVFKGSKGFMSFAVMWSLFCGVMTVFIVSAAISGSGTGNLWIGILVISLFDLLGVGMLVGAINMGRRRGIIDIIDGTLLVTRQSLFGTKQDEWRAEDLRKVVVGPSGTEVNDEPVLCMLVKTKKGRGQNGKLFAERSNDELHWLVARVRRELRM